MIEFATTKTIASKKFPGVEFTIRVMTEGVRTRLALATADALAECRDIQVRIQMTNLPRLPDVIVEGGETIKGKIDMTQDAAPKAMADLLTYSDQIEILKRSKIDPQHVKAGFVSMTGIALDGRTDKFTADDVLNCAPEELYAEILEAVKAEMTLSADERENLESPTILVGVEDGAQKDTTVESATKSSSI